MEAVVEPVIYYPESDDEPMAENTVQFRWIVIVKKNLDLLFYPNPDVFVAGDLFWYSVEGDPDEKRAPDVMVVFGRPKGDRGSYKQWEENGIAPQVVFEIPSPGNTASHVDRWFTFYQQYGVEEYYIYDPEAPLLQVWLRSGEHLVRHLFEREWISPRLGIRFKMDEELQIFYPDGTPFKDFEELAMELEQEHRKRLAAEAERDAAFSERDTALAERDRLAAKLRALGIDPDE